MYGIDVSKWQGDFDFHRAILENEIEFAILKIGGGDNGLYKDKKFDRNYKKCKELNLPIGCYFYGKAMTRADAKKEVDYWLSLMQGLQFEFPIYYDVEGAMLNLDRRTLTDIIIYVCDTLEKHGYYIGVYGSASKFNNKFYDNELVRFTHWVAGWSKTKPTLKSGATVFMWQFGGETNLLKPAKMNGVTVDQDFCYEDFPKIIKQAGLNGFVSKPFSEEKTPVKSNCEIADEVVKGLWGNGEDRKIKLATAGYDYKTVQKIVNEIMKGE